VPFKRVVRRGSRRVNKTDKVLSRRTSPPINKWERICCMEDVQRQREGVEMA